MNKEPLDTAETIRSTSTSLRLIPDFLFEVIEKYKKNTDLKKALKSGEIFCFDNRRILHGRTKFEANSGHRHLQGYYIERDEVLSKLNYLNNIEV